MTWPRKLTSFNQNSHFDNFAYNSFSFKTFNTTLRCSACSYFDLESGFMMRGMAKEKYYEQWEQYMVGLEEEYKLQQSSLDQRLEEKYKNNDKNNKGESSGIKVNKIAIP